MIYSQASSQISKRGGFFFVVLTVWGKERLCPFVELFKLAFKLLSLLLCTFQPRLRKMITIYLIFRDIQLLNTKTPSDWNSISLCQNLRTCFLAPTQFFIYILLILRIKIIHVSQVDIWWCMTLASSFTCISQCLKPTRLFTTWSWV